VLAGRYDKVTEEDWDLAGVVMQVSDRTRERIQGNLASAAKARHTTEGRAAGVRKVAEAEVVGSAAEDAVLATAKLMLDKLNAHDGQRYSDMRRQLRITRRPYAADALDLLVDEGRVRVEDIAGTGEAGRVLWLT
jgi:hypothetical protein